MRIIVGLLCFLSLPWASAQMDTSLTIKTMGVRFVIELWADSLQQLELAAERSQQELLRLDQILSSWRPDSEINRINQNAGHGPMRIDHEVWHLLLRCEKIWQRTSGAFDPTVGPMLALWRPFLRRESPLPDSATVAAAHRTVGWHRCKISKEYPVIATDSGVAIDLGGIGKGYAANRVRNICEALGVARGMVDAGGDILFWGNGEVRDVGIADPESTKRMIAAFRFGRGAVATSGDYEQYVVADGSRYSHIIDPKTGWPVMGMRSVTVLCPDAEMADAMATAVFVLGAKDGLEIIEAFSQIEAIILDDQGKWHHSSGVDLNSIEDHE